jgi:hypothetical protein
MLCLYIWMRWVICVLWVGTITVTDSAHLVCYKGYMYCWLGFYFIKLLISMQCWRQDRFCAYWLLTLRIGSSSRDTFQISNRPSCGTIQFLNLWILNLCMHLWSVTMQFFSNLFYASWPVTICIQSAITICIQSAITWHDSNDYMHPIGFKF